MQLVMVHWLCPFCKQEHNAEFLRAHIMTPRPEDEVARVPSGCCLTNVAECDLQVNNCSAVFIVNNENSRAINGLKSKIN